MTTMKVWECMPRVDHGYIPGSGFSLTGPLGVMATGSDGYWWELGCDLLVVERCLIRRLAHDREAYILVMTVVYN